MRLHQYVSVKIQGGEIIYIPYILLKDIVSQNTFMTKKL